MIKKLLTMSAGIVLGSMITTASFADSGHTGPECHAAMQGYWGVMATIEDCTEDSFYGKIWTCTEPTRKDCKQAKKSCLAVVRHVCAGNGDTGAICNLDQCSSQ